MNEPPIKPIPNSYWVRPNQLLAGEYPLVAREEESAVRLQDMLLAGVTCFINLTDADELSPYHGRLPDKFGGKPIRHQRFAITDHGVPESIQQMNAVLDAIDEALEAGACVYVHCRAGIGRTGTVVGCHLVRHGQSGVQALETLNTLWLDNARSKRWPHVPETDEQENFILEFPAALRIPQPRHPAKRAMPATHPRVSIYQGALLGLVVGDVLGGLHTSGTDEQAIGKLSEASWSGEAALAWALADSLLHCGQQQALDQMQRYLACQKQGRYTAHDLPATLPSLVQKAIGLWQWKRNPLAGSHDPAMIDAHPLARCVPVALFYAANPVVALSEAAESARTSTQAPIVLDACRVLAAVLLAMVESVPANQLMQYKDGRAYAALRSQKLKPELERFIDGGWRTAMTQPAGEDVVSVLASACHALATTDNYQAAVFKCLHNSVRPHTVGAVCGALAGALYGVQGLPIVWCETLPKAAELLSAGERLLRSAPAA